MSNTKTNLKNMNSMMISCLAYELCLAKLPSLC